MRIWTQVRGTHIFTWWRSSITQCYPNKDILIQTTDIEEHKKELSTKRKTPLKKANTRKPKQGPKITPKPTRKLEPESQEILEAPNVDKDPDFDANVVGESKA